MSKVKYWNEVDMLSFVYCIFGKKRGENIKFIKIVDEWDS